MNAKPKFTPGPWEYTGTVEDELGFPCVTDESGCSICSVIDDGMSDDEEDVLQANAHLIAAAPDLLAVVKAMEDRSINDKDFNEMRDAALSKAEGR